MPTRSFVAFAIHPSLVMRGLDPIGAKKSSSRVPDAVQRERQRSGAPLIRDLREGGVSNDPRKSGLPDLRIFDCRSRVDPRSVSAAHHSALSRSMLRSARDTPTSPSRQNPSAAG
jgi:hypothetical protein